MIIYSYAREAKVRRVNYLSYFGYWKLLSIKDHKYLRLILYVSGKTLDSEKKNHQLYLFFSKNLLKKKENKICPNLANNFSNLLIYPVYTVLFKRVGSWKLHSHVCMSIRDINNVIYISLVGMKEVVGL